MLFNTAFPVKLFEKDQIEKPNAAGSPRAWLKGASNSYASKNHH
jgi:hypothetical protein